jgi:hypothetical protein
MPFNLLCFVKSLLLLLFYNPVIFARILDKRITNKTKDIINTIRNLGILNKFLNGAKIIKIKPAKLLIKNRG